MLTPMLLPLTVSPLGNGFVELPCVVAEGEDTASELCAVAPGRESGAVGDECCSGAALGLLFSRTVAVVDILEEAEEERGAHRR